MLVNELLQLNQFSETKVKTHFFKIAVIAMLALPISSNAASRLESAHEFVAPGAVDLAGVRVAPAVFAVSDRLVLTSFSVTGDDSWISNLLNHFFGNKRPKRPRRPRPGVRPPRDKDPVSVPEPAPLLLLGSAVALMLGGAVGRRRR